MIKNIGFEENKKCRVCNLMAFYQIEDTTFCEKHMKGFIEFKNAVDINRDSLSSTDFGNSKEGNRKMKFWDKFVKDSTELFILLGLIELTDDEKKELEK